MTGAGGGGFAYALAKSEGDIQAIKDIVATLSEDVRFHAVEIADVGLIVGQE